MRPSPAGIYGGAYGPEEPGRGCGYTRLKAAKVHYGEETANCVGELPLTIDEWYWGKDFGHHGTQFVVHAPAGWGRHTLEKRGVGQQKGRIVIVKSTAFQIGHQYVSENCVWIVEADKSQVSSTVMSKRSKRSD